MIHLYLGKLGSGKTLHCVRNMYETAQIIETYSNIKTKKIKNNHIISPEMIVKREIVDHKKKRDGTTEPVYKMKLNTEFWQQLADKPLNVILDEVHSVFSSRRSMSKMNVLMSDWLALLRRVLGSREGYYGNLIMISQLNRRIDVIGREMASSIVYHIGHYKKQCRKCSATWRENSEMPEPHWQCPKCNYPYLRKYDHAIQVIHFETFDHFEAWRDMGQRSFFKQYILLNVEKYFPMYNTMQWDNLFSEYY